MVSPRLLFLPVALLARAGAAAAVQLASPFTAHLVHQQGQPIPVWGTAGLPAAPFQLTIGK